jgi:Spy/CpxP family protein refolding chaperone
MRRLISLMVVALLAMPVIALAGPGFKHGSKHGCKHGCGHGCECGYGHGGGHKNPAIVKKGLRAAGCSDQQIRSIEILSAEADRKRLDIQHEAKKAQLNMQQLMQVDNPDRAAIFQQIDEIGAIELRLKKNWVGLILDIRKELTPAQWEQVHMLRAERMMKHRKHMRNKRHQTNQP